MASTADEAMMRLATECGAKSEPVQTAYCVGAVLALGDRVIATGFSRELPGNTHAEECCLIKMEGAEVPWSECTMYTTMEPCSKRLSAKPSCTQLLLARGIGRVVVGVEEPPNFVTCEGIEMLQQAGVAVVRIGSSDIIEQCRALNRHLTGAL